MARTLGRGFRDFRDAISGEGHPAMHELDHQPIEPTAPPAAAMRASAQRPLAGSAATGDPMAAPDAEVATAPSPTPDPVAADAVELDSDVATAPAPTPDPVAVKAGELDSDVATAPAPTPDPVAPTAAEPDSEVATAPAHEPAASRVSKGPGEGSG